MLLRQLLPQVTGKMGGREVRLAEEHEDYGVGMAFTDFNELGHRMAVAGANLAQIFTRHAVETVDGVAVLTGGNQQFVEGAPFVPPVGVEADAFAEFSLVDLAAPPFF